jgi:alpha-D-xyloside xylohydrolase
VLQPGADHRSVYLPAAPAWYDFWTGATVQGARVIDAAAPLDRIPLYVRAGSILPLGPEIEYAAQNPGGPIELRIYRGADGAFDLYEDSGDSYDYEKGKHAIIPIRWNNAAGTLTLGARQGSFPGMIAQRTFRIVLVGGSHGAGPAVSAAADKEVRYQGEQLDVKLR